MRKSCQLHANHVKILLATCYQHASGHIRGQHILALMSTIVFTAEFVVLWTCMGVLTLPSGGVRSL